MKALVCNTPNALDIAEVPAPELPAGWVPVDVHRVGICGTDFHIYGGRQPYLSYPRIMGHEVSGCVAADYTGTDFRPGELVLANPYIACGTCHACRAQKPNCCENIQVIGVHRDGAMAERFTMPPENLIRAKGLTADQAAMVEFLAIGRHAVARTRIIPDAKTLIVGGGPIGLACALFARIDGGDVTVVDISDDKLAILRDGFGFKTLNTGSIDTSDLTSGFEHVFDATGNIHAMNAGLKYVAHGGTYTLVSVVKEELVFADPEFHKRETTLLSSRNALADDFRFVIDAIRDGKINTDRIGTHRTTLDGAVIDLPKWANDRDSVIKAIIEIR